MNERLNGGAGCGAGSPPVEKLAFVEVGGVVYRLRNTDLLQAKLTVKNAKDGGFCARLLGYELGSEMLVYLDPTEVKVIDPLTRPDPSLGF